MVDSSPPKSPVPPQVWGAATLTLILASYAVVFAVPLCITGSFVGWHILVPGLVHAILGLTLVVGLLGILARRRWARWLVVSVTSLVAFGLPVAMVREAIVANIDRVAVVFGMTISLISAAVTLNLSSPAVGVWLRKRSDSEP
jgi:hypothetical protein